MLQALSSRRIYAAKELPLNLDDGGKRRVAASPECGEAGILLPKALFDPIPLDDEPRR